MKQGRATRALDAALVLCVALGARLMVAAWGAGRIPPTGDGKFYQTIAERIAQGLGYTWLWRDGVVTYAAHYPVGYPALLGSAYALFGAKPAVGMIANALIGSAGSLAAWALVRRTASRGWALAAGLAVALHVGLVAYTPALMTEGITASLGAIAVWEAQCAGERTGRTRSLWLVATGLTLGLCTLVRPQSLLLAPLLGWFAAGDSAAWQSRLRTAAAVALLAVLPCLPWVARNKIRMGHAALSFNGGWNLLIGTNAAGRGAWAEVEVPEACRLVFDEAEKDICFGREAVRRIGEHPVAWLSLVPSKLSVTFDYCGGAGWYLHQSNAKAFPASWKLRLGIAETLTERLLLVGALVTCMTKSGPRRRLRLGLGAASLLAALTPWGWLAWLGLGGVLALFGRSLYKLPLLFAGAALMILTTALIHSVFFGAGRYCLVVFPLATVLAFARQSATSDSAPDRCGPLG